MCSCTTGNNLPIVSSVLAALYTSEHPISITHTHRSTCYLYKTNRHISTSSVFPSTHHLTVAFPFSPNSASHGSVKNNPSFLSSSQYPPHIGWLTWLVIEFCTSFAPRNSLRADTQSGTMTSASPYQLHARWCRSLRPRAPLSASEVLMTTSLSGYQHPTSYENALSKPSPKGMTSDATSSKTPSSKGSSRAMRGCFL